MKQAANVVDRLVDLGAKLPGTRAQIVEEVHRMVGPDYIPGGSSAREVQNVRVAPPGHRCGCAIGSDIQSGPLYCGEPATWIGDVSGGSLVATCNRHEGALRRLEKKS